MEAVCLPSRTKRGGTNYLANYGGSVLLTAPKF